MKRFLFLTLLLIAIRGNAQKNLQFSSVDSLFKYAESNSASIKAGNEQRLLAKWTKLTAMGNTINLRSPISGSWTDNTELPVSYVPGEVFGGPKGSVKELAFGQEFVTNYSVTPQIDIINVAAWSRIKSASINEKLTEVNNLLAKRTLFESISAAYFNIVSIQQQRSALNKSMLAADSIQVIVSNKYNQGIVREQDKNNAAINLLTVQDKLEQLNVSLEQQYNALKLLCDIPSSVSIEIDDKVMFLTSPENSSPIKSSLIEKQSQLQYEYLKSELRYSRLQTFAPTVSFVFNQAWQQNSNVGFFDSNSNHFSTQYYGVKLSVPFPLEVSRLAQNYTSKINYSISKINEAHGALQNQVTNKQLELEQQKALSSYNIANKIEVLKAANYLKSMNQYKEGILPTENLLLSFTDKVNAQLTAISATSNLLFIQTKIKINNSIQ